MSDFFMRDRNDELLFWKDDLSLVIRNLEKRLQEKVNSYEKDYVMNTDIEVICSRLKEEFEIKPIILHKDRIYLSDPVETEVDISQDPNRAIFDRDRPHYVQGVSVTFAVPYEGDINLLYCKASGFTMNPPSAKVTESEVQFTYYSVDPNPEVIKKDFEQRLRNLEDHIRFVMNDIEPFNNGLLSKIKNMLEEKVSRISKSETMVNALGYARKPIKVVDETKSTKNSVIPSASKKKTRRRHQVSEWDFFICHASEDKQAAAIPICQGLLEKGYSVWLDEFELKLGDSLRKKIDDGLRRSRFGIVILSSHFFEKEWPKNELDGLVALEQNGKKRILPLWHNVEVEDVRKFSPILAGRLAAKTSDGIATVIARIIEASK